MEINILLRLACIMLLNPFFSITANAGTVNVRDTVYGTVVNQNLTPIPGIKLQIEGSSEYVYTDLAGHYRILCSQKAKRVIVFFPKDAGTLQEDQAWHGGGLGSSYHPLSKHGNYKGVNLSIMGGRVKDMRWYAKY